MPLLEGYIMNILTSSYRYDGVAADGQEGGKWEETILYIASVHMGRRRAINNIASGNSGRRRDVYGGYIYGEQMGTYGGEET